MTGGKMMLIKIVLLAILSSVSIVTGLFFTTNGQSWNNDNFIFQIDSKSPEIALEKYWQASFNGDEKMVNTVSSIPNEYWWTNCISQSSPKKDNSDKDKIILVREDMSESKSVRQNDIYNKETSFSGENIPDNIRIFSRYIFGSKVKWNRFKVVDKHSYNDETLLNIEIANYSGDFSNSEKFAFAFKKIEDEWKIIGIIQTGVFKFVDDQIRYGDFRPICK